MSKNHRRIENQTSGEHGLSEKWVGLNGRNDLMALERGNRNPPKVIKVQISDKVVQQSSNRSSTSRPHHKGQMLGFDENEEQK